MIGLHRRLRYQRNDFYWTANEAGMLPIAPNSQRIDEVDGLRAVAMTMVVAQHCGLMPFGWTGVWLFFVISGYVITRTLMSDSQTSLAAPQRYLNFMSKRFFRIVPIYLLYLFIARSMLLIYGHGSGLADLPYLVTFTYNWQMIYNLTPVAERFAPFGHLWTLSIEEQFYVVYPLLLLFMPKRWFRASLVLLVMLGPIVRLATSLSLYAADRSAGDIAFGVYASSLCQFDAFAIGALISTYEREIRDGTIRVERFVVLAALIAISYAAVYVAINASLGARGLDLVRNIYSGILAGQGREIFSYVAVDIVAAALVVAAVAGHELLRPMRSPVLVWIGTVSYGAYLYHALILWVLNITIFATSGGVLRRLALFFTGWLLTVAVASLSYILLERPLMRWARRSLGVERDAAGTASAERITLRYP